MKGILRFAAVVALGVALSTPVVAGHRDSHRGHHGCRVRGGYHTGYYAPYARPVPRASVYFSYGAPVYAPVPVYYYSPAPVMAPVYYPPVWVPAHYAYNHGVRFTIAGYWSH